MRAYFVIFWLRKGLISLTLMTYYRIEFNFDDSAVSITASALSFLGRLFDALLDAMTFMRLTLKNISVGNKEQFPDLLIYRSGLVITESTKPEISKMLLDTICCQSPVLLCRSTGFFIVLQQTSPRSRHANFRR